MVQFSAHSSIRFVTWCSPFILSKVRSRILALTLSRLSLLASSVISGPEIRWILSRSCVVVALPESPRRSKNSAGKLSVVCLCVGRSWSSRIVAFASIAGGIGRVDPAQFLSVVPEYIDL